MYAFPCSNVLQNFTRIGDTLSTTIEDGDDVRGGVSFVFLLVRREGRDKMVGLEFGQLIKVAMR